MNILLTSEEDFEEKLGINDSEWWPWKILWSKIFNRNQMKEWSAKILAWRRSQKIKDGEFDKLPSPRKYQIMRYCINVDKNLFTEEEVFQEKNKITIDDKEQWIEILLEYNMDKAVDEVIKLWDYHLMFYIATKKLFSNKQLCEKVRKACGNKFTEDEKETFERLTQKYGKK